MDQKTEKNKKPKKKTGKISYSFNDDIYLWEQNQLRILSAY